jgi:predicted alpha/beta hydrolase family esterase
VPLDRTQEVATQLQAPLTVIEGGGHLNSESDFTEFDKLKDDLLAAFPL